MKKTKCTCGTGFPTWQVLLLAVGFVWLFNDLKIFAINLPWMPIALIVLAIGLLINWKHGQN